MELRVFQIESDGKIAVTHALFDQVWEFSKKEKLPVSLCCGGPNWDSHFEVIKDLGVKPRPVTLKEVSDILIMRKVLYYFDPPKTRKYLHELIDAVLSWDWYNEAPYFIERINKFLRFKPESYFLTDFVSWHVETDKYLTERAVFGKLSVFYAVVMP